MPSSTLSRPRLLELLGGPVPPEALEEALFASKAEVGPSSDDALEVSVTPDRLDLLSEGGLGLFLQGALGRATGAVRPRRGRPASDPLRITVDASVAPLRPAIAGVCVQPPTGTRLDEGLLTEAVRVQELLHATVGRDRRAMSLGIYPARRIRGPVRYALEPIADVTFTPLGADGPVAGAAFFESHPYAAQYGAYGRAGDRCLTLRDAGGAILSLPPVLNSRERGEAVAGDRGLLLEATGTRERAVREGLGLLLLVFAARGWSVRAVPVDGPGGTVSDGEALIRETPRILPSRLLADLVGDSLPSSTVVDRLARCRLGARRVRGGWTVGVPPWRPDLLGAVDLAEEVIVAGGLRSEDGLLPAGAVRGRRRRESAFHREVVELLLGLGFAEPLTTVLVSDEAAARADAADAVRVANPVSREFSVVRNRLLLSHLEVLARNTRHPYPQRFAEVAPVVVRASSAEAGAETRYHAGFCVAADGAGFAEAAALVDYLLRAFDVGSVREPTELPVTIPGRAARVRVAGEAVAELGELRPELLGRLGVPVPVAWAELDLTALAPLVARRETTK